VKHSLRCQRAHLNAKELEISSIEIKELAIIGRICDKDYCVFENRRVFFAAIFVSNLKES